MLAVHRTRLHNTLKTNWEGYDMKLTAKEYWDKKLSNLAKRSAADRRKLEKYEREVSEIQTAWANDWVVSMLRRYKKYHNRDIFDEIIAEAEAEAEKGKFYHYSEEFFDYVYDALELDIDYETPRGLRSDYSIEEVLHEISCILIEEQGDRFWVNKLNNKNKIKKKLEAMKDERGFYVIN